MPTGMCSIVETSGSVSTQARHFFWRRGRSSALHDRAGADGLAAGVLTAGILCPSHKDGGDFDLKARTGVQTSEPTTMFDHGKGSRSYTNEPHDVGKRLPP